MFYFSLVFYTNEIGGPTAGGMVPVPKPGAGVGTGIGSTHTLKDVDRVRNYFPETWLWTNSTAGLV